MLRKLFVLVVCLTAAVATASAQTPPYNEIWYTTTDGRPLFINSGYKKSVDLYMYSDTYNNGRGVLKFKSGGYINFINSGLFDGKDRLKSITIPNSVTSIGYKAFEGCSSLTSITIPDSVTSIGKRAFEGCSSLTSVTIPNSVTSIEWNAFSGCSSLTSITIPNSVTSIGEWAFNGCSSLISITIPNSVTSIGDRAFRGCSSLKSFKGKYASDDGRCLIINGKLIEYAPAGLTSYTIPNSVTWIEEWTFADCSSLTSITVPNSVKRIGGGAFSGCSSLTSITIGNSVTSIGNSAFYGCSSLTSITIGNSVTSIDSYAFEDCSSLKSVKVSNKYCYDYFKSEVDDIAFYGANASDDGRCLIIDGELKIFIAKGITEYTIPESVTSIEDHTFNGCSSLTSITIGNSVTSIGYGAFRGCSNLTSITIPESVKSIEEEAFRGCSNLKSVKVANKYCYDYFKYKVANIAFYGANVSDDGRCLIINGELQRFIGKGITEYTIPESVTSIGDYAFYGCDNLTSITCLATTPPAIDDLMIDETTMIYVPKEAVKAYKKDPEWSRYKKQIKAIK